MKYILILPSIYSETDFRLEFISHYSCRREVWINQVSWILVTDLWPWKLHSKLKTFLPDELERMCRYALASLYVMLHGWIWQCCECCTFFEIKDSISFAGLISSQECWCCQCVGEDTFYSGITSRNIHARKLFQQANLFLSGNEDIA